MIDQYDITLVTHLMGKYTNELRRIEGLEARISDLEHRLGLLESNVAHDLRRLEGPHIPIPDDLPEPGDRCKHCGKPITWIGPNPNDWEHEPS